MGSHGTPGLAPAGGRAQQPLPSPSGGARLGPTLKVGFCGAHGGSYEEVVEVVYNSERAGGRRRVPVHVLLVRPKKRDPRELGLRLHKHQRQLGS